VAEEGWVDYSATNFFVLMKLVEVIMVDREENEANGPVKRAHSAWYRGDAIRGCFNDPVVVDRCYSALAAIFNTSSVLIAWSAETENPTVKLIAQLMIAFSMSYSILHGASEYNYPPVYFLLSYVASLINVWSGNVSEYLGSSGLALPLVISVVSFIITCCCDKKIVELIGSIHSGEFIETTKNEPFVFLRLWKIFFGKVRTGIFSMVGTSLVAGDIVEWMSFIEPLVFITFFLMIISQSNSSQLVLPRCDATAGCIKFAPWVVMLVVECMILIKDSDFYFYHENKLPLLAMFGLLAEVSGFLFIKPKAVSIPGEGGCDYEFLDDNKPEY